MFSEFITEEEFQEHRAALEAAQWANSQSGNSAAPETSANRTTSRPVSRQTWKSLNPFRILDKDDELFQDVFRTNGQVPERREMFYNSFPKKASTFDSEYHNANDFALITRWVPHLSVLSLVKLFINDDASRQSQNPTNPANPANPPLTTNAKTTVTTPPRDRPLTAFPVPTAAEQEICASLHGTGLWDRAGVWRCLSRHARHVRADDTDELGLRYFTSYEELLGWKQQMKKNIAELEAQGDFEAAAALERKRMGK